MNGANILATGGILAAGIQAFGYPRIAGATMLFANAIALISCYLYSKRVRKDANAQAR